MQINQPILGTTKQSMNAMYLLFYICKIITVLAFTIHKLLTVGSVRLIDDVIPAGISIDKRHRDRIIILPYKNVSPRNINFYFTRFFFEFIKIIISAFYVFDFDKFFIHCSIFSPTFLMIFLFSAQNINITMKW